MTRAVTHELPFRVSFVRHFGEATNGSSPEAKLRGFRNLHDGWRYGGGKAISESAIRIALNLLRHAPLGGAIQRLNVFPRADGGVTVAAYLSKGDLAFHIKADGRIDVDSETDSDLPLLCGLTLRHVLFILHSLGRWSWSFSSTYPSTTRISDVFGVPASKTQVMGAASPQSTLNARNVTAVGYAIMPVASMVG